jgi:VanZ family protein
MSAKKKQHSWRRVFVVMFVLYMGVLIYLYFGKMPSFLKLPRTILDIPSDKVGHFLMFLPYPFLAHGSSFTGKRKWRDLLFVHLSGILIAFVFELLQSTLAVHRTTDPWDLVANVASLTLATLILSVIDLFKK